MRDHGGKRKSIVREWPVILWFLPVLILVAGLGAWWYLGGEGDLDRVLTLVSASVRPLVPGEKPAGEVQGQKTEQSAVVARPEPSPSVRPEERTVEASAPPTPVGQGTANVAGDAGLANPHPEHAMVVPAIGEKPGVGDREAASVKLGETTKPEAVISIPPVSIAPEVPILRDSGTGEVPTVADPSLRGTSRLAIDAAPGAALHESPPAAPEPQVLPGIPEPPPFEEASLPADGRYQEIEKPSVHPPVKPTGHVIAMVIDDLGYNKPISKAIALLPFDLTLAVLPGGGFSREVAQLADAQGKEVILHQPMQPQGYPGIKPGPGGLYDTMSEAQIHEILEHNLREFPRAKGINNHMGSHLTNDARAMDAVMHYLKPKGLYFLDSRTSTRSVAASRAIAQGVPALRRDVFIDNVADKGATLKRLAELVTIANKFGQAVGIGHPHPSTLEALREWLPSLRDKGIRVVRLSHLLGSNQVEKAKSSEKPRLVKKDKPEEKQLNVGKESKVVKTSNDDRPATAPGRPAAATIDSRHPLHEQTTDHTPKVTIVAE
ncbi:MAG: divergent polysaccharide deacetylase family protein [Magnetococcales bacterium]|nr:divergent polysaccharide deacetylase family protein [Magnetococcales bacterium]